MLTQRMRNISFFAVGLIALIGLLAYAQNSSAQNTQTTNNPYEWVGQAHNDGVLYVIEQLEGTPIQPSTTSALVNRSAQEFVQSQSYPQLPTTASSPIFNHLSNTVAQYDGRSLAEFQQTIIELEHQAKTQLQGDELATFQIGASVARYSAELWTPAEYGGLDGLHLIDENMPMQRVSIGDIVGADVDGAISGGLEGAIRASAHAAVDYLIDWLFP